MYYSHPSKNDFKDAIEAAKKRGNQRVVDENNINESPRRKKMRDNAVMALQGGGRNMKDNASKVGGEIDVGSIVQKPLNDVDTTKVDGKTLTLVVVEKKRKRNKPANV